MNIANPVTAPVRVPAFHPVPAASKAALPREEKRRIRRQYSVIGWGLFAQSALTFVLMTLLYRLLREAAPWILDWGPFSILSSYAVLYLIGLPAMLLILRLVPDKAVALERKPVGAGRFLLFLFSGYTAAMVIGVLSSMLVSAISSAAGVVSTNPISDMIGTSGLLVSEIVALGIAPVMEEFIFRRLIFRKTAAYGPRLYMFFSAAMFGLYHGNLYQMFYAFALGLLLACLCWRMGGSIRQSWLLHVLLNGLSTIASFLPGEGLQVIYVLALFTVGTVCGIVLFVKLIREKKRALPPAESIPSPPASLAFVNAGMAAWYLIIAFFTVFELIG